MTTTTRIRFPAIGLLAGGLLVTAVPVPAAVARATTTATSRQFAGYQVTKAKTHIRSASVTFVIPSITCKKNFSGVGPSLLIASTVNKKTNTYSASGGGVGVACQHHAPVYVAIPIVDGKDFDEQPPLASGDIVTVTVRYGAQTVVTLDDSTAKQLFTERGRKSVGETASVGSSSIEINQHGLKLDPFTSTVFTDAKINGKSLGSEKPVRTTWVDSRHKVLVAAGKITKHSDFVTTFKAST
jgi:hypothetical protein